MDCSLPEPSLHGILQVKILAWVAIPFSISSWPRDQTQVSLIAGDSLLSESESESCSVVSNSLRPHGLHSPWNFQGQNTEVGSRSLLQGIFLIQGSNPGLLHCGQILYYV